MRAFAVGSGRPGQLNEIYVLLRLQTNILRTPQQKLIAKHRVGAKVTKRYDDAATPYQRVLADEHVTKKIQQALTRQFKALHPARIHRDLLDLQDRLLALVGTKRQPTKFRVKPPCYAVTLT